MNYLEICQRTHDIVGFQGQFASVQATGYQKVLTTAVQETYEDIQRYRSEWNWLKANRQVNMDETKTTYTTQELWGGTTAPDVAGYRYINWTTDTGSKRRLREIDWDTFQLLALGEPTNPRYWTHNPATMDISINQLDQLYTMDLFYTLDLDILSTNTQVPLLPNRHHQALIYGACMKLATYVGQPTLYDTYSIKYAEEMGQLMREANPAKVVRKRPVA